MVACAVLRLLTHFALTPKPPFNIPMRPVHGLTGYTTNALDEDGYINTSSLRQLWFSHLRTSLYQPKRSIDACHGLDPPPSFLKKTGKRHHVVFLRQELKKRIPENYFTSSKIPFQPLHETDPAFLSSPKVHLEYGMLSSCAQSRQYSKHLFVLQNKKWKKI